MWRVIEGDVSVVLPTLEAESFDAVLCDPPYGLSFMGKAWDHGVPSAEVWEKVLRLVKPGGHLIAFGGTRTFHRLAVGIEDAGFEIRDCLSWLYGQGFPKSLDISKALDKAAGAEREVVGTKPSGLATGFTGNNQHSGPTKDAWRETGGPLGPGLAPITAPATPAAITWQGYGTALKPAWEPAILAMKPTTSTFAKNALEHGVAGLNVDGCRIAGHVPATIQGQSSRAGEVFGADQRRLRELVPSTAGRWPANVVLDEEAAALLDEQTPVSRFFYCAKASRGEREAGLEGFEAKSAAERTGRSSESAGLNTIARPNVEGGNPYAGQSSGRARNHHPTVKPIKLCEWLARLLLPPKRDTPRRILVPFSGSGSEMIGALLSGWDEVVGIELEPSYVKIAEARLAHWESLNLSTPQPSLF